MKQIYVIAFFLMSFHGFSQLHVKPYGDLDSYVYVETGFLYVEKDINLKLNPFKEKKASIYLRYVTPHLQANSNSNHSGQGLLYVI